MPRKSSKTAHVLNLLTSNKDAEEPEQEQKSSSEKENSPEPKKISEKKKASDQKNSSEQKKVSEKEKSVKSKKTKKSEFDDLSYAETEERLSDAVLPSSDVTLASAVTLESAEEPEFPEISDFPENADSADSSDSTDLGDLPGDLSEDMSDAIQSISEINAEDVPIITPPEKMAEDIAQMLSDTVVPEMPEMETIDPLMEKMRDYDVSGRVQPREESPESASNSRYNRKSR